MMSPKKAPWFSPEWKTMNESQKRYLIEQWNLSCVRRGRTVDQPHPVIEQSTRGETHTVDTNNQGHYHPDPNLPVPPVPKSSKKRPLDSTPEEVRDPPDKFRVLPDETNQLKPVEADIPARPSHNTAHNRPASVASSNINMANSGRTPMNTRGHSRTDFQLPRTGDNVTGEGSRDNVPIPRPICMDTVARINYRKEHYFSIYGFASTIFTATKHTLKNYFLTTTLAEIPWDRAFMYMTPSEFELLPLNSRAIDMQMTVIYKNTCTAFPINAIKSALAIPNQAHDIITASALNQNYNGVNLDIKRVEKCKPTDYTIIDRDNWYNIMHQDMYGVSNNSEHFCKTIPRSLLLQPITLRSYYALYTDNKDALNSGWDDISLCLGQYNSQANVGKSVFVGSYQPQAGYLKSTAKSILSPYSGTANANSVDFELPIGTHGLRNSVKVFSRGTGTGHGIQKVSYTDTPSETASSFQATYNDLIEKSQFMFSASSYHNHHVTMQPSCHIGVKPLRSVTYSNIICETEDFIDVRAEFKVTCNMTVEWDLSTRQPHAGVVNVKPGR